MKDILQSLTFYFLIFLLILSSIEGSQAAVIYGEQSDDRIPVVQIIKQASTKEAKLGTNITISLNITNWSNEDAFNLTITEPLFSDWAYSFFEGWEEYTYVKVAAQASLSYHYNMTPQAAGEYTIEATEIDYYDENGTLFNSRSQEIKLSIYEEAPPISFEDRWQNVLWIASIIIIIPVAAFFVNKALWRKD